MALIRGNFRRRLWVQGSGFTPNAFTFVELMIAATIVAILFVGLGTHLRGGIAVWQRATQSTEALQRQRVALDRLERDLTNGFVYDPLGTYGTEAGELPEPVFEEDEVAWFTVSPSGTGSRVVQFVHYECKEEAGVSGLWRTGQRIGPARAHVSPTSELLLPGCTELAVEYASLSSDTSAPLQWASDWQEPAKSTPKLLRVTLELASESGRATTIERVLMMPMGELKEQ